jgi:hypothetical protein
MPIGRGGCSNGIGRSPRHARTLPADLGKPIRLSSGIRGTIPRMRTARWRSCCARAVGGGADRRRAVGRADPLEQRATHAAALHSGSTKHIERNHSARDDGRANATMRSHPAPRHRVACDHETVRIGGSQCVYSRRRGGSPLDEGLVQTAHVVVEASRARSRQHAELVRLDRPQRQSVADRAAGGRGHAASPSSSRAPLPAGGEALELRLHERVEVAVEDGAVLPVSYAVRRSLTIWIRVQHVAPDLVAPAGARRARP